VILIETKFINYNCLQKRSSFISLISSLLHSYVNLEWCDIIKLSNLLLPRQSGNIKSLPQLSIAATSFEQQPMCLSASWYHTRPRTHVHNSPRVSTCETRADFSRRAMFRSLHTERGKSITDQNQHSRTPKFRGTSLMSNPPPVGPTVALCLGTYGDPRGVGISYERGTPVATPYQQPSRRDNRHSAAHVSICETLLSACRAKHH